MLDLLNDMIDHFLFVKLRVHDCRDFVSRFGHGAMIYKIELRKVLLNWCVVVDIVGGQLLGDLLDCEVSVLLRGEFGG